MPYHVELRGFAGTSDIQIDVSGENGYCKWILELIK